MGGYFDASRVYRPLIEHWDGTQWSIVTSPQVSGYLLGADALTAADAWAVGYVINAGQVQTLALHWDGSEWTQTASPNPGLTYNFLYAVSAVAFSEVWAVAGATAPWPCAGTARSGPSSPVPT